MQIRCENCSSERKVLTSRDANRCDACGGNALKRRIRESPGPLSHGISALLSMASVAALATIAGYAVLTLMPVPVLNSVLASILIALVGMRFAVSAMNSAPSHVVFPGFGTHVPGSPSFGDAFFYTLLFEILPAVVVVFAGLIAGLSVVFAGPTVGAWIIGGIVIFWVGLLVYAPLAVVSYLRTGSATSFLSVFTVLSIVVASPFRSIGLILAHAGPKLAVYGVGIYAGFYAPQLVETYKFAQPALMALAVLYGFAMCGLFVRKNANALGVDADAEDWLPVKRVVAPVSDPTRVPLVPSATPAGSFAVAPSMPADQYSPPDVDPFSMLPPAPTPQPVDLGAAQWPPAPATLAPASNGPAPQYPYKPLGVDDSPRATPEDAVVEIDNRKRLVFAEDLYNNPQ